MLFASSVLYPELLIFFFIWDRKRFDRDLASVPSNIKTASEFLYKVKLESLIMFYYNFPVQIVICIISKSFHFCFQPKVKLCIKIWKCFITYWSYRQLKFSFTVPETCSTVSSNYFLSNTHSSQTLGHDILCSTACPQLNM